MGRPLEGIKVLDFTHGVAGPYCTMVLADLGCEVIKIEKPGRGDPTRYMNVAERFNAEIPRVGGDYFLAINRNKRSVGVDMKTEDGRRVCHELSAWADIAVQNFRPGVMARLGLDYAALSMTNPRLIYANISAYGDGRLKDKPGMDIAVQARSGVMRLTGALGSDEPIRPGVSLADFGGGIYLATAVLAALFERERSGKGQEISVSLLDATMSMLINYSVAVGVGGEKLTPLGSGHPQLVPYQAFPTRDGSVVIATGTNKLYRELCAVFGRPDLGDDERFRTNQNRVRNRALLVPLLSEITATRTTAEWIAALEASDVPCAPVNDMITAYREIAEEAPHMTLQTEHPILGPLPLLGSPFVFKRSDGPAHRPPPLLAEHTAEVLREVLGWDNENITALQASQARATAE